MSSPSTGSRFAAALAGQAAGAHDPGVQLGIEVLPDSRIELVAGKSVGLITHPAGVDSMLAPACRWSRSTARADARRARR